MANSTKVRKRKKPRPRSTVGLQSAKPYPEFELFVHPNGQWARKILGRTRYFGRVVDGWEAAKELYDLQKDDLFAGRTPRARAETLTVLQLCDRFYEAKEMQHDSREITAATLRDYYETCKIIVKELGKTRRVGDLAADDFEKLRAKLSKRLNANSLGNEIQRIRTVFKYGFDSGLFDAPIRFGPMFVRPSKRILRGERQSKGPRTLEPRELRRIIKAADRPLRAMIMLGLNCGFGNNDCGSLPLSAIDLQAGWINFARPKTNIPRRIPLWPETVIALHEAIGVRPSPKDRADGKYAFLTKYRTPWAKESGNSNPISAEMKKLLVRLNLYRPGISFYCLRHIHETVAGECADQVAVDAVMGHADPSMSAIYRQRISDERLRKEVNTVRRWLFRRDSVDLWLSRRAEGPTGALHSTTRGTRRII